MPCDLNKLKYSNLAELWVNMAMTMFTLCGAVDHKVLLVCEGTGGAARDQQVTPPQDWNILFS